MIQRYVQPTITTESLSNRRRRRRSDADMEIINRQKYLLTITISALIIIATTAALSIPAKYDGFVYKPLQLVTENTITIEAFFDPVCPDSRDAWPPLKAALQHYGPRISLILHPFSLPYHDNSFVTSRALHVVNKLNASATYDVLELFFKHQEEFYNEPTLKTSRVSVVESIAKLVASVGNFSSSAVESRLKDRQSDLATRVSFKYGCSRGVYGTPFFFVNGFVLPDGGSAIEYEGWRGIIDPLLAKQTREKEDTAFLSMLSNLRRRFI